MTDILIQILKQYQGELTEQKIIKLTKIVDILKLLQDKHQLIIPESSKVSEILENDISDQSIYSIIKEFFPLDEIDNEIIQIEWKKELNTKSIPSISSSINFK